MSAIGLKLKGEFKFDLYDSGKNLISSSDFMDNFITNSGVYYPLFFAFADCFRYVSVGSGTTGNSIIKTGTANPETTGLQIPIMGSGYSYVGARPMTSSSVTNYSTGCGYRETISGIDLFRQWTLPNNTGFFSGYQTFNEFMVSPGQPYVTGITGQLLCTCDENDSNGTYGNDCSSVAMYYNWVHNEYEMYAPPGFQNRLKMCDAINAFARVVYPVNIVPNSYLNITYRLSVIPQTGMSFSSLTNNVTDTVDPNWSGILNVVSAVTQPGIKLINDGTIANGGGTSAEPTAPNQERRLQHFDYTGDFPDYDFGYEYGESFVPPMGIPLEPSLLSIATTTTQNIQYYVSSDNTEFLVSNTGIFSQTGSFAPWNPSSGTFTGIGKSGLAPFVNNNSVIISVGGSYWPANPNTFNIRTSTQAYPQTGDITQVQTSPSITTYIAPVSTITQPQTGLLFLINGGVRTGQTIYGFNFISYRSDSRFNVKSLVAGYVDATTAVNLSYGDDVNMVPFFDSIFSGTGQVFIPPLISGLGPYYNGSNTGVSISGAGDTNYFYLLNGNGTTYPLLNTILTWSVPCPQGTSGC